MKIAIMPETPDEITEIRACNLKSTLLVRMILWIMVRDSIIIRKPNTLRMFSNCGLLKKLPMACEEKNNKK